VAAGRHWLERWAARVTRDGAICGSRFAAATLPLIYPRVPCEVVYCPLAPPCLNESSDHRSATRTELETTPQAMVVIQVGRMESLKGHGVHLEALARVRDLPNWVCWIVGGPQREYETRYFKHLCERASTLEIADRVRFIGQRSDVRRLLAAADIYCQPNIAPESFGLTFVEALYAGLAVVTTEIGGALEIVDDSCGMLVAPDDPAALADALRGLIEDRELRSRLGAGGPARAAALCDPRTQMVALDRALTRLSLDHVHDSRVKTVQEPSP
jgi:glycosyltransferase involved in cell wall biosynthesis